MKDPIALAFREHGSSFFFWGVFFLLAERCSPANAQLEAVETAVVGVLGLVAGRCPLLWDSCSLMSRLFREKNRDVCSCHYGFGGPLSIPPIEGVF